MKKGGDYMTNNYRLKPRTSIEQMRRLQDSVEELSTSINELVSILRNAGSDIAKDEISSKEQNDKILRKIDLLIKHNEAIAQGILLVVDMMKDHLPQITRHVKLSSAKLRPLTLRALQQGVAGAQQGMQAAQPSPQQQTGRPSPVPQPDTMHTFSFPDIEPGRQKRRERPELWPE
ncbi:hypothetical protein AUJ69_03845 [Candidatus Woesearchaeota archaeon CG1_02_47_18]|nr:MAG: hypothetical protein AUJ69_03845 [Candidatus Woesearchaeota archaeon CG1_02_47_18]